MEDDSIAVFSPVSVVVVAGLGAGLRLGNRAGGESESYSNLEENWMRKCE